MRRVRRLPVQGVEDGDQKQGLGATGLAWPCLVFCSVIGEEDKGD